MVSLFEGVISVLVILAGFVLGKVSEKLVKRIYTQLVLRKAALDSEDEMRLERGLGVFLANIVKYLIYGVAIVVVMQVIGLTTLSNLVVEVLKYVPNVIGAMLILVLGLIGGEIAENITLVILSDEKFSGILKDIQINISGIMGLAVKYYVYLLALTMAAGQLGISSMPLEILIGVISIAFVGAGLILVNHATKYTLPNILASEYLRRKHLLRIGDHVEFSDFSGDVVRISNIYTIIRDSKGDLVRVPNYWFVKEKFKVKDLFNHSPKKKKTHRNSRKKH